MSNVDRAAAAAFASPDKVRIADYRCHAHGGKCGQRLASIWSTPMGRVLYTSAPATAPTVADREALRALGVRQYQEGFDVMIRFVGPDDDGTTIVAACPKHGPRSVTISLRT